jgi:hypothetical protein
MVGSPLVIAERARARLQAMLTSMRNGEGIPLNGPQPSHLPTPADLIITPCEVNEQHGTGTLLLRMFPDWQSIISLRTSNFYDGAQAFGAAQLCLPLAQASRPEIASWLKWYLSGTSIRRIICFPYLPADVIVSLAAKEMFDAPLCTYIMDDKNVCADGISDALMTELMEKSGLRLVIGPEMRAAYQAKYGMNFWVVPPLVPEAIIRRDPVPIPQGGDARRGVLLGNIWGQQWLEMLRVVFRGAESQVDWYCNQKDPVGLDFDREALERDGIRLCAPISEANLPGILARYGYAVVPTDTLDGWSPPSVQAIAELSLPSRIPTMITTAHIPVLVIGHPKTCAARFVTRFELGEVVPYQRDAVTAATKRLLTTENQTAIRQRAATLSSSFSSHNSADWIWRSLAIGAPCDHRFEDLMPPLADELS